MTYEQQQAREMLVGKFLSINLTAWVAWVKEVGDDAIPEELHQHVSYVIRGLDGAPATYQMYLQALCLLSDSSLEWLTDQAWPYQEQQYGGDNDRKDPAMSNKARLRPPGERRRVVQATGRPAVTLPHVYSWESQQRQYPERGEPGISYFAGDVSATYGPGTPPVDCLLWRDNDGIVRGILNHYPIDYGQLERAGAVNIWVDPDWQRRGIGFALVRSADRRWRIDWTAQRFTAEGAALATAYRERMGR